MWAPMIVVVLAAMTIAGDWFLKLASDKDQAFTSPEFIAGALLYGLTAIGWVVVFFLFRSRIRPDDSIGKEIDRDIASGDFNPDADPPETDGSTGSRP